MLGAIGATLLYFSGGLAAIPFFASLAASWGAAVIAFTTPFLATAQAVLWYAILKPVGNFFRKIFFSPLTAPINRASMTQPEQNNHKEIKEYKTREFPANNFPGVKLHALRLINRNQELKASKCKTDLEMVKNLHEFVAWIKSIPSGLQQNEAIKNILSYYNIHKKKLDEQMNKESIHFFRICIDKSRAQYQHNENKETKSSLHKLCETDQENITQLIISFFHPPISDFDLEQEMLKKNCRGDYASFITVLAASKGDKDFRYLKYILGKIPAERKEELNIPSALQRAIKTDNKKTYRILDSYIKNHFDDDFCTMVLVDSLYYAVKHEKIEIFALIINTNQYTLPENIFSKTFEKNSISLQDFINLNLNSNPNLRGHFIDVINKARHHHNVSAPASPPSR